MTFRTSLLVLVLAAAWADGAGSKKPITVHDLVAEQPPNVPVPIWRPDGKAFAYKDKGKVLLYDIQSLNATEWFDVDALEKSKNVNGRQSAPFSWQNRRVNTSGMQWFADGSAMLVPVNGGLYVVDEHASKPRLTIPNLAEDDVPTLSPDGKSVLFRKNFNLFVVDLGTKSVTQLTSSGTPTLMNGQLDWVYPEELDLGTAFWWSPDSKYIAYMQFDVSKEFMYPHEDLLGERAVYEPQRFPQAGTPNAVVKIGVIAATGGETKWMQVSDSSNALLARVAWLPDSAHLAVQRLNRVQNRLDLLLANAADGSVRTMLTETDKYWLNLSDDLQLLRDRPEFVWSSERSGFRHLYLYSINGELERQLTSGEWPVRRVLGVDEHSRVVYYVSGQDSPLEDQLYRVSLDGGAPQRLSSGSGNHNINLDGKSSHYLDTFSNLRAAPQMTLHEAGGRQLSVFWHEKSVEERYQVLPSEIVTVPGKDGTLLYARLIKPAQFNSSKKYPAVVFVYGGPQIQSVRNVWTFMGWEQVLAHRGFVVWQLDNRGSNGRGHAFESPVYHEMGRTELEDQRTGLAKLLSMGFVDPQRIGISGWSYGGYMTLYSLLHAPDVFRAGIAGAPVTDWHNYDTIYTERYMGLPDQNNEGYRKSSDILAAANLNTKLMIVCNYEDDNVLFQNTMQMMTALHRANKQFEFMLYPQKTHGVTGDMRESMLNGMTDFFERNLKGSHE